ncbi:energy-coupling factor ABC transporter transmembrane protein [Shimwellia pseudoproteus]|uniref:energy-coupling factor ABC transporter transmembrane protein n=1 Tax=Shimwellia pseudoproteus TaxID=570012 RepID=UPI0018EB057B|nr:energy-coupling factor ABC transporter transmembrane protein [Shimwellia pseudoproteus]MBJ3814682.1 energy-coupling factor ABC transporter transmembrane protein [Shimwellia pseudoproteus]
MLAIDKISGRSRWRHRDPRIKLLCWIVLMTLAMSLPPVGQAALIVVIAALSCWMLRVSPGRWLRWIAIPAGFLLVSTLTILFSISRDPQGMLWSTTLGGVHIGILPAGLEMANHTLWRSLAAISATFWLVLNLPFVQLIQLLQRCRVPVLLIEQILLTWRFIFILLDEVQAIHQAQTLRFGYRTLPGSYRSLAMLVGMLFSRVMVRYQQMVTALDVKLYQGDFHL